MKAAIHTHTGFAPCRREAGYYEAICIAAIKLPCLRIVQLDRLMSFPSAAGMSFIKTHPSK